MADPTGVRIRLGWHLAVKCVAALAPRLRRHHASRVAPLAPRAAEAYLLAEDHPLADGHMLAHPLAPASKQILRCDKRELPRSLAGSTLHPPLRCPLHPPLRCLVVFLLGARKNAASASATPASPSLGPNGASTGCQCTAAGGGTGAGASREANGLQSSAS